MLKRCKGRITLSKQDKLRLDEAAKWICKAYETIEDPKSIRKLDEEVGKVVVIHEIQGIRFLLDDLLEVISGKISFADYLNKRRLTITTINESNTTTKGNVSNMAANS